MNEHLQNIVNTIEQSQDLSNEVKDALIKEAKAADKAFAITAFKLERTEKVKYTTSVVLEETIEELEQKRQAVETQNKELEIESALERVRSRSMAMQKSEELREIIQVVYDQFIHLAIHVEHTGFIIDYKQNGDMHIWLADKHAIPFQVIIPYFDSAHWNSFIQAKEKGLDFFVNTLSFEEKNKFYQDLFQHITEVPEETRDYYFKCAGLSISTVLMEDIGLYIENFSGTPYSAEENKTLMRFGKVFQQTYTRFLDLKKAEAQAREAKIETSLERVRSRSLAMHKSDELRDVVKVVFKNLEDLEFAIDGAAFIGTPIEGTKDINIWIGDNHAEYPACFRTAFYDAPNIRDLWKTQECGLDFYGKAYSKEEKNSWFRYAFEHTDYKYLPGPLKTWILEQEYLTQAFAVAKNSMIGIHYHIKKELTDNEIDILKRFSKVFDQSYIRFLDLQKAEAQSRESQIQLALERVRARTMAMQQSTELPDAANILFQQMETLGMPAWSAGYCIWDNDKQAITLWMSSAGIIQKPFRAPVTDDPSFIHFYEAWKRGETFYVEEIGGDAIISHYQYMLQLPVVGEMLIQFMTDGGSLPTFQIFHLAFFSQGFLLFITYEPVPEAHAIFKRFGSVFEQTYTRFLDLKKAEAQARESKIETALEKVRSRSLAMYKSDEIIEVVKAVFEKLNELNIELNTAFIIIFKEGSRDTEWWLINKDQGEYSKIFVPYADLLIFKNIFEVKEQGKELFSTTYHGEEKNELFRYLFTQTDFKYAPPERQKFIFESEAISISMGMTNKIAIQITRHHDKPFSNDDNEIINRFAQVFNQSYIRFLDLQKAEAQAREAQIEAALERVRSRSMAMHHSKELHEVADVLFQQMLKFGGSLLNAGIVLCKTDADEDEYWISSDSGIRPVISIPHTVDPVQNKLYEGWKNKLEFYSESRGGDELKAHYNYMASVPALKPYFEEEAPSNRSFPTWQKWHAAYFSQGYLFMLTVKEYDEEKVLVRFAKIFDQAYIRFLDLQKAETQARESQIQLALERVRARTMAMQKSDELSDAVYILFQQFKELNENPDQATIGVINEEENVIEYWVTMYGSQINKVFKFSIDEPNVTNKIYKAWKENKKSLVIDLSGDPLTEFMTYRAGKGGAAINPDEKRRIINVAFFSKGLLNVQSNEARSEESIKLLERFASVFEQTYTRFLDLQKAEAQAREAKIEAGLERVRYSAMAMKSSEDVGSATAVVFNEISALGVEAMRCGITIIRPDMTADVWAATTTSEGKEMKGMGNINFNDHPLWVGLFDGWKNKEENYSFALKGDDLRSYYKALASSNNYNSSYIQNQEFPEHYFYANYFEQGALFTFSLLPHDDNKRNVLKKFTAVFSLTFRRFLDLQKAEAQALEAVKRASVDRVRAEIASMRTPDDLRRITPLIWNELKTLGVPFIRCGVFIMEEDQQKVQTLLSTPDGKAIATLHVPFNFNLPIIIHGVDHWRKQILYTEHWDAPTFSKSWAALASLRDTSVESPQAEHPPENLYLHLLPFLQGMLYVGNVSPMTEEELQLVQNLADAFSTAYARYEDFNKLESANVKIEKTLVDLKQTQAQLVQSEKMASLGELTAGIAHEIQNPLNFVNNFSEVNKELLTELNEEIEKGNYEEAKIIASDIAGNEEKIIHHGKRADSIVKGMLQHSRSSSGVKESTDINALCDEYLRLAYHGLRAKDKSFNATMKTGYDETIGKINIIPQDIGRAILNIITNAFYAVNEKKKSQLNNYEPTISLSTKKTSDGIEITLADNGNGIPKKIVDKIFQPFFTTKPTGQGTGLGLSLTYDILKAHGGEIKVKTKGNDGLPNGVSAFTTATADKSVETGTEFIIHLPH